MENTEPQIQETPDIVEESPVPAPVPEVSEKRGRGRPPGAKNKVKIVVKPVEIPEPEPPSKPVVMSTPRAKPARVQQRETPPEIDPGLMHSTIMRYAFEHAARSSHEVKAQRANKFDVLLSRMVR